MHVQFVDNLIITFKDVDMGIISALMIGLVNIKLKGFILPIKII